MKILKISTFALLISIAAIGQTKDIDYNFINWALRQVVVEDSKYFLLHNKIFQCSLNEKYFEKYLKELHGKIDSLTLKELINNCKAAPSNEYEFDVNFIAKNTGANLISSSQVESLERNRDYSRPINERIYYRCTTPAFDNKKVYAIIDFGGGVGSLNMQGQKYLFKKEKNSWQLIGTFDQWTK